MVGRENIKQNQNVEQLEVGKKNFFKCVIKLAKLK